MGMGNFLGKISQSIRFDSRIYLDQFVQQKMLELLKQIDFFTIEVSNRNEDMTKLNCVPLN